MDVIAATRAYEAWLKAQGPVVAADLAEKHRRMAADAFGFLRGTFYRWVPVWRERCADLIDAPQILGVGDLHVENFGTWRDAEGRLVWGVNDLDEAATVPYTLDLVRLATSALLVHDTGALRVPARAICDAILDGYAKSLHGDGCAFVLEEHHPVLRAAALSADREPKTFWAKFAALRTVSGASAVRRMLKAHLPSPDARFRLAPRVAGVGSLGRPRYVALADWAGGFIAREAKVLLPSAYAWALGQKTKAIYSGELLHRAVRCSDPHYKIDEAGGRTWVVRRLAPHCSRIEFKQVPGRHDEIRLLHAMGAETANLHLGTPAAIARIQADLRRRGTAWLTAAAQDMRKATRADWSAWRAHGSR